MMTDEMKQKNYELAEVSGATGNVQIIFGDGLKEIIDEYDLAVNSDSVSYEEVKETIEKIKNLIK